MRPRLGAINLIDYSREDSDIEHDTDGPDIEAGYDARLDAFFGDYFDEVNARQQRASTEEGNRPAAAARRFQSAASDSENLPETTPPWHLPAATPAPADWRPALTRSLPQRLPLNSATVARGHGPSAGSPHTMEDRVMPITRSALHEPFAPEPVQKPLAAPRAEPPSGQKGPSLSTPPTIAPPANLCRHSPVKKDEPPAVMDSPPIPNILQNIPGSGLALEVYFTETASEDPSPGQEPHTSRSEGRLPDETDDALLGQTSSLKDQARKPRVLHLAEGEFVMVKKMGKSGRLLTKAADGPYRFKEYTNADNTVALLEDHSGHQWRCSSEHIKRYVRRKPKPQPLSAGTTDDRSAR